MKIFILMNSIRYGGANKVLVDISNYLAGNPNNEVTIVTYASDERNFYYLKDDITVVNLFTKFDHINKVRRFAQLIKLKKIISREKPHVVLTFSNIAKLLALYSTLFTKTKLIISERIDPYNYKPGKKYNMYLRYILADGCVFQTHGAANYFPKSVQEKSIIIPNFIEKVEHEILPITKRENQIAFVGRFELRQKRQDVMLLAFKKVIEAYPDMVLSFYGDGPDVEKVKKMAVELGISKSVKFQGVIKNITESLLESKLFVMTSDFEGIPNALMEAMAIGLPVISTNCSPGGAELLIENYKNGIIVPRGNIDKVANAIIYLLDNPEIADKLGNEAKKIKETYSKREILPQWEKYIIKIVGRL